MATRIPLYAIGEAFAYSTGQTTPRQTPLPSSRLRLSISIDLSNEPLISRPILTPKSRQPPSPTPPAAAAFSRPPPRRPGTWRWFCHLCGFSYRLGATNRCLNDGHYFCSGSTIDPTTGQRIIHSPCESEFDFDNWKEYGKWRRGEFRLRAALKGNKEAPVRCSLESNSTTLTMAQGLHDLDEEVSSQEEVDDSEDEDEEEQELDISVPETNPPHQELDILNAHRWHSNCSLFCDYPSHCRRTKKLPPDRNKTSNEACDTKASKTSASATISNSTSSTNTSASTSTNPRRFNINDHTSSNTSSSSSPPTSPASKKPKTSASSPSPTSTTQSLFARQSDSLQSLAAQYPWLRTSQIKRQAQTQTQAPRSSTPASRPPAAPRPQHRILTQQNPSDRSALGLRPQVAKEIMCSEALSGSAESAGSDNDAEDPDAGSGGGDGSSAVRDVDTNRGKSSSSSSRAISLFGGLRGFADWNISALPGVRHTG